MLVYTHICVDLVRSVNLVCVNLVRRKNIRNTQSILTISDIYDNLR